MGICNETHSVTLGAWRTFCLAVVSLFTLCKQYSHGKKNNQWIFFSKLNSPFKNQCVFYLEEFNSGNTVPLFM